jgi:hypothetical protein
MLRGIDPNSCLFQMSSVVIRSHEYRILFGWMGLWGYQPIQASH